MANNVVETAIQNIVETIDPGAIVTKFLVIAEAIDKDGKRAVYSATNGDAQAQDTMGLLNHALEKERAGYVIRRMKEEQNGN